MKFSILRTNPGWVGIGTENGTICRISIGPSKENVLRELVDRGADGPANAHEVEPLIDLVKRAAAGEDVPVNGEARFVDGTPFQRSVWKALRDIPLGQTISYAEMARRVGKPGASRAVGSALGRNPLPLLYPCHRVIAADGTIGGFGGGLEMKRLLLKQEGVTLP
jgi:methylated-DNA-[protein]-cysteine S-methyltransferase